MLRLSAASTRYSGTLRRIVNRSIAPGEQAPLNFVVRHANTGQLVGVLLDVGAEREHRDGNGETPLATAVANLNEHAVYSLLVRRAQCAAIPTATLALIVGRFHDPVAVRIARMIVEFAPHGTNALLLRMAVVVDSSQLCHLLVDSHITDGVVWEVYDGLVADRYLYIREAERVNRQLRQFHEAMRRRQPPSGQVA